MNIKTTRKPRNKFEIARWLKADLWGDVLNSPKTSKSLYYKIYKRFERRSANFVLRIDKVKPKPRNRIKSRYGAAIWERRKLSAYYGFSFKVLRHLCLRSQDVNSSYYNNFIRALECTLTNILWRVGFFKTPHHARAFIQRGNVLINKTLTHSFNLRVAELDYITFRTISFSFFLYNLRRGIYHLRNSHLLINFRIPCIRCITFDPKSVFYYTPLSHRHLFFTTDFRKR